MSVDDSCDDDGRDGNSVGNFTEERTRGTKGGASDWLASVAVGDDGNDEVHTCVDALEEEESFGVLFRGFELRDEAKKGDVS